MLLAIVYGGVMLYQRTTIKAKWYHYCLLALVDVEANFLVVKANQYTSITSVMLLDCWAIPCVLVLTWVFLRTQYRLMKISGVLICIVGAVMVVFSDVHAGSLAGGSNPVKGDFLVVAGATLYAVSNTSEEFLVKNANRVEVVTFLGFFGAIVSAIQIGVLERGELKAIHWSADVVFPFLRVAVTLFLFYSLLPVLLKTNGSAMFTLSLLTSDMWAVLIRTFAYHEKVDWLYFLAFATTAIGLVIYSVKEKDEEEQGDEQRKLFDEEDGETIPTKKTLIGLGLGQIISLLSTCIAFASSQIARKGINAPTSQSFLGYLLLAIVYGGIMLYRRPAIKAKWYYYLLLALVDVEANFLVAKAYQNTSITSVMLLDCWAIPCVLVLTWVFLRTQYRLMKISGVLICIVGVVMVVFSDVHAGDRAVITRLQVNTQKILSGGSNSVKGDLLVIGGATLYAVSNTSEEFLVTNADRIELMSFMGLFGAIIGAIQISILERGALKAIHWSTETVLPYLGIALAMFLFYSLLTVLLKTNGSAMFTLSLLTSDMWAVLIRTFAYHEKVDWLYFLAFATTAIGLIIYSMKEKDQEEQRNVEVVDVEAEQRNLFDEDGEPLRGSLIGASTRTLIKA
ncbi:unnamed protein product [Thlaspi arvense]|uniref:Solute carrier family 35 member F1 n=1 Tax=Thlaspi arvense TaxID=13288 RepID=A0AAU9SGS5_THLAR|nr:unnamed protein product [Thlaspi arvense]